jgi:hypothetical protein
MPRLCGRPVLVLFSRFFRPTSITYPGLYVPTYRPTHAYRNLFLCCHGSIAFATAPFQEGCQSAWASEFRWQSRSCGSSLNNLPGSELRVPGCLSRLCTLSPNNNNNNTTRASCPKATSILGTSQDNRSSHTPPPNNLYTPHTTHRTYTHRTDTAYTQTDTNTLSVSLRGKEHYQPMSPKGSGQHRPQPSPVFKPCGRLLNRPI